ncbi:MAG TPA: selenocysteine-specific translation elongation factor [Chthoniobacterales bacterium]|nr:selenocysteine-specific translation elongation factor [Chthoniobacterales bacterium]
MIGKHFILATAGHVDHGKSALIKALSGTDPDRLPEEKIRGITIDLGFAALNLSGPNEQQFRIGIIDVPGHEDFVRNMIAGVGSIDVALLVVAADDGWMPQTEEHLQILTYLGVKRAVVVLTKSDLGHVEIVGARVREKLEDSPFSQAPIVSTSARTGEGIDNLKRALAAEFALAEPPRNIGKPRLFVDRAFSLHGIGTVVTGTLTGGELHRGQTVSVQPANLPSRVRSMQSHGRDLAVAQPGMRTALNLPDIEIGDSDRTIKRGDLVTISDFESTTDTLDALLEKSARIQRQSPAGRPLKNASSAFVYFGTSRVAAKVILLEAGPIEPGQQAIVQLRLQSPLPVFLGDRFVLRDASEQQTIAGGTVLHPKGDREHVRDLEQFKLLRARASAPDDIDVSLQSELARHGFSQSKGILKESNFSAQEIRAAISRLEKNSTIVVRNEIAADGKRWRDLRERAIALVDRTHGIHPQMRGLEIENLRAELGALPDDAFDALIIDLCRGDFIRNGTVITRVSHRTTLRPEIALAATKIRNLLAAAVLEPLNRKEMTQDTHSQQALRFLIERGELIELSSEIVVLREAVHQMQKSVVDFLASHGVATASQLRQQIGTSRRVVIPFLEYLDRTGVTRRIGDTRQLRDSKSPAVAGR